MMLTLEDIKKILGLDIPIINTYTEIVEQRGIEGSPSTGIELASFISRLEMGRCPLAFLLDMPRITYREFAYQRGIYVKRELKPALILEKSTPFFLSPPGVLSYGAGIWERGMIEYMYYPELRFGYLEHMRVMPLVRRLGYGRKMLQDTLLNMAGKDIKWVVAYAASPEGFAILVSAGFIPGPPELSPPWNFRTSLGKIILD